MIAVSKEAGVEVTGPGSLAELTDRVRAILELPEGTWLNEDNWESLGVSVKRFPWEDASYDYWVIIYGESAEIPGWQVFDALAASTDWALRLCDDVYDHTLALRPTEPNELNVDGHRAVR